MLGQAAFFGIKAPIPRFQRACDAVCVQHGFQHSTVAQSFALGRLPHAQQKVAHTGGVFGHFRLQLVIGKAGIAQKLGALFPQAQGFSHDGAVVSGPAVCAALHPSLVSLLPQIASGRELQERHDDRPRQRHRRPARALFFTRRPRRCQHKIGQTCQIRLGQGHDP